MLFALLIGQKVGCSSRCILYFFCVLIRWAICNAVLWLDLQQTSSGLLQKFRKYLLDSNLYARLQSKYAALKISLGTDYLRMAGNTMTLPRPSSMAPKSRPKRVGKAPQVGQPKVFGCALEDYIEVCKPLCYMNLYRSYVSSLIS